MHEILLHYKAVVFVCLLKKWVIVFMTLVSKFNALFNSILEKHSFVNKRLQNLVSLSDALPTLKALKRGRQRKREEREIASLYYIIM